MASPLECTLNVQEAAFEGLQGYPYRLLYIAWYMAVAVYSSAREGEYETCYWHFFTFLAPGVQKSFGPVSKEATGQPGMPNLTDCTSGSCFESTRTFRRCGLCTLHGSATTVLSKSTNAVSGLLASTGQGTATHGGQCTLPTTEALRETVTTSCHHLKGGTNNSSLSIFLTFGKHLSFQRPETKGNFRLWLIFGCLNPIKWSEQYRSGSIVTIHTSEMLGYFGILSPSSFQFTHLYHVKLRTIADKSCSTLCSEVYQQWTGDTDSFQSAAGRHRGDLAVRTPVDEIARVGASILW